MITKITVLPATQLVAEHIRVWRELQQANSALDSPFFRSEFTQAVAATRDDVHVAVLERDSEIVGFFPFERAGWRIGRPVGGRLSDFHGVICRPDLEWDSAQLIRACGLAAWNFDHLVASQVSFKSSHWDVMPSPFMDVSRGFEAYLAERSRVRSNETITGVLRKMRKVQREVGPLRFVPHTTDRKVFESMMTWKSEQYRRTHVTDVFAFPWTVRLLERLLDEACEDFGGVLSALYAGDQLAAVHLGLRSRTVLHSWFPAYGQSLSRYSPGLLLFVKLAEEAPGMGLRRLDLGAGPAPHKESFMSDANDVACGSVTGDTLSRVLRTGFHRTQQWVRSSPLRAPAAVVGRLTRPLRGWLAFR